MKKLMIIVLAVLFVCGLFCGCASAENNTTVINVSDPQATDDTEPAVILYINSEQYKTDYAYWYDYHKARQIPFDSYRGQLIELMMKPETDAGTYSTILSLLGKTDYLDAFMDVSRRSIDDMTGAVTYDLGVLNWWALRFGAGVDEMLCPQTVAEGNALYDLYLENYIRYVELADQLGVKYA